MTTSDFNAPTLIDGFATWGIDELRGLIGFNRVPPDHNGAVGASHVVSVFNHALQVFDKAGTLLSTQTLDGLFGAIGGTLPVDPNILYDAASDRFVYVSFEVIGTDATSNPGNDQVVLNVAVSQSGDPTQGWHVGQINAKTVIGGVNGWSDFPGIAVDGEAIYITANMFAFDGSAFLGNRVWIVDKGEGSGGLYDGGAISFTAHDPIASATDLSGLGVAPGTLIPARIEGDPSGVSGIYLVAADALKSGNSEVAEIIRISNPLAGPTFTAQSIVLGDISIETALPQAPQLGSAVQLGSGDGRVWSGGAVEFGGKLYFTFDVAPKTAPDVGQVTVHWVEVDASNPTLALVQQGNIGGETIAPATHTFMPSIAVNKDGSVLINFSASGPSVYPGAYYALRAANDPAGQFGPAQTLAPGVDWYFRNRSGEGISGQTTNRWGDFSGVGVDPVDGSTFWFFNMFADTRGSPNAAGQDGRWRLAIGTARPTILDFQHPDGTPAELYVGGLGADGLRIIADAAGSAATIDFGASGDIVVALAGGAATARFVENLSFVGGAGADAVSIVGGLLASQPRSVSVVLNGGGGADTLFGGLRGDALLGGGGSDLLDGGGGRDAIDGGAGSDRASGGSGADTLVGDNGDDTLAGGVGKDSLDGGDGSDSVGGGVKSDQVSGGAGDDTLIGEGGNDVLDGGTENDRLIGGAGRDALDGGVGDDAADGGAGDDAVFGATGRDVVIGGAGADTLDGGGGVDSIFGGDDDDVLMGAAGADVLAGGAGDDTVVFRPGEGIDALTDFVAGAASDDMIRLVGFGGAFDSFAEVIAAATDDGIDTTVDLGGGDLLVMRNVVVAALHSGDFLFG